MQPGRPATKRAPDVKQIFAQVSDLRDRYASRSIDISDCETVCLMLGPYRNLTTLTASTLFLHPHCQVLNHGGPRILGQAEFDFLSEYSKARMDRFVQYALRLSTGGERGRAGGSITLSHAFDDEYAMGTVHAEAGGEVSKAYVRTLVWKESHRTSNWIRDHRIDLSRLIAKDCRLRFLMPVRNPLDCAESNLKTGHAKYFGISNTDATIEALTERVLESLHHFALLQQAHPDRFFTYYEHSIDRTMLENLAAFLEIEPTDKWISAALSAMKVTSRYEHAADQIEHFRTEVDRRFGELVEHRMALHQFYR